METTVETMETEENRRLAQQWLHDAKALIDPLFIMNGITPKPVNITRGFMENTRSGGKSKGKAIGQCHYSAEDGVAQIYISPYEKNVLHILAHELTHAYLPGHGHDVVFKNAAYSIGLVGKPTATVAGPDFTSDMDAIAEVLGDDPHSPLKESTKKKQGTRSIKVTCYGYLHMDKNDNPWPLIWRTPQANIDRTHLRCMDAICAHTPIVG